MNSAQQIAQAISVAAQARDAAIAAASAGAPDYTAFDAAYARAMKTYRRAVDRAYAPRRADLRVDQVFRTWDGQVVRLDRSVPGDATKWYVADWWNGWAYQDSTVEPGDLVERLADDYSGEAAQ